MFSGTRARWPGAGEAIKFLMIFDMEIFHSQLTCTVVKLQGSIPLNNGKYDFYTMKQFHSLRDDELGNYVELAHTSTLSSSESKSKSVSIAC